MTIKELIALVRDRMVDPSLSDKELEREREVYFREIFRLAGETLTSEELIALVRDRMTSTSLSLKGFEQEREELLQGICRLAGCLARSNDHYRELLKKQMKPEPKWSETNLQILWVMYSIGLREADGDQMQARRRIIELHEEMTGEELSEGYLENLLAREVSLEGFRQDIQDAYEKRRERGEKTSHRGWQ